MKRTAIVWVTLAWAAWSGGGRMAAAGQVPVPLPDNDPGRPTPNRVYVINRDRADAIPVSVRDLVSNEPVRVTVTGTPSVTLNQSAAVETRVGRQAWEYRQVTLPAGEDPTPVLNAAGAEGWEAIGSPIMISNNSARLILKRPR
jgi:hypothetical protein